MEIVMTAFSGHQYIDIVGHQIHRYIVGHQIHSNSLCGDDIRNVQIELA